ncbi:MAG: PTS cellobiose transporter subunit IIC [Peptoniphilaceae bacterium]|nr:PTS cellobiose transporter subunit IIC [Peptoniphilaceae bacterium]
MFQFLEKYLMGPMTRFSQLRFVRAITAAGVATIPFTIVGSLFLVLNILPQAIPALQPLFDATFVKITDLYMLAFKASMGIIALYFLLVISREYTRIFRDEESVNLNPMTGMLLSVFGMFMLIPQFVNDGTLKLLNSPEKGILNGWAIGGDGVARLGAIGIFTSIVVSFLVVHIYRFCVKRNLMIKMPEAVPEGVANSFSALIPAVFVAIFFIIANGILVALGTDIYQVVQIPFGFVTGIANTYLGLMVIFFLISALWLVGIHGATIITSLVAPVTLVNLAENVNGANHVLAGEFYNAYIHLGGSGATLGLIVMLALFARSKQLKVLGRAAFVPGLFNINEPIIFGMPIVYNPIMAIPFFLAPMASATLAYVAIKSGIVHPIVAQQPWPTPIGIGAFIATGGDWKAIVLALACALVAAAIYFPFFKAYDLKLHAQELGENISSADTTTEGV